MEIAAAAWQKPKFRGNGARPLYGCHIIGYVIGFHGDKPRLLGARQKSTQHVLIHRKKRVRKNGDRVKFAQLPDHLVGVKLFGLVIKAAFFGKQRGKRLLDRADVALFGKRFADMRAVEASVCGFRLYFIEADRVACVIKPFYKLAVAGFLVVKKNLREFFTELCISEKIINI